MKLTDEHLEVIRNAASTVDFGSVKILAGTDNHFDVIVEHRIRLPKENAQTGNRPPLLANTRRSPK